MPIRAIFEPSSPLFNTIKDSTPTTTTAKATTPMMYFILNLPTKKITMPVTNRMMAVDMFKTAMQAQKKSKMAIRYFMSCSESSVSLL